MSRGSRALFTPRRQRARAGYRRPGSSFAAPEVVERASRRLKVRRQPDGSLEVSLRLFGCPVEVPLPLPARGRGRVVGLGSDPPSWRRIRQTGVRVAMHARRLRAGGRDAGEHPEAPSPSRRPGMRGQGIVAVPASLLRDRLWPRPETPSLAAALAAATSIPPGRAAEHAVHVARCRAPARERAAFIPSASTFAASVGIMFLAGSARKLGATAVPIGQASRQQRAGLARPRKTKGAPVGAPSSWTRGSWIVDR